MTIEAIGAIGAGVIDAPRTTSIETRASGADFAALLGDGVAATDASLKAADSQLRALAAGHDVPLHDVMISMEQARIDLTLMAEVRNRIVESYQELMRMQL